MTKEQFEACDFHKGMHVSCKSINDGIVKDAEIIVVDFTNYLITVQFTTKNKTPFRSSGFYCETKSYSEIDIDSIYTKHETGN